MAAYNRYGLSRDISAPVARAVRQRCGFGCVLCGSAIYQYHHFDPPFADAHAHDARGITLLCGRCHQDGSVTKHTIVAANAAPRCRQQGYTGHLIQSVVRPLSVVLGPRRINAETMILDENITVMGMSPAEEGGSPCRLNACLKGDDGADLVSILNNEWRVGVENYDVSVVKNRLEVRRRPHDIILAMEFLSDQEVRIERLHMCHKGYEIICTEDCLSLRKSGGGTLNMPSSRDTTYEVTAPIGLWFKGGQLLVAANWQGGAAIAL
jgi:hypothetical protein